MRKVIDRLENIGPYVPKPGDEMIVCRCEEITKGEIRKAIHDGMFTMSEIKRYLRPGMGLCQGQTCEKGVKGILAAELGIPVNEIASNTSRTPVRPMEMIIYQNEVR